MIRLWLLIPSRIRRALAWMGVVIAALVASYFGGRKAAQTDAKVDELENEVEAHARLNAAPTGDSLSDDERSQWLRDYAKRNGG
jgi:hypothetical protein